VKIHPILLLCGAFCVSVAPGTRDIPLQKVVDTLVEGARESGSTFIRNGKKRHAKEAAKHLEKKHRHFPGKGKTRTPGDFIAHADTRSLMSGTAHIMRPADGIEVKPADRLLEELRAGETP